MLKSPVLGVAMTMERLPFRCARPGHELSERSAGQVMGLPSDGVSMCQLSQAQFSGGNFSGSSNPTELADGNSSKSLESLPQ